MTMIFSDVGPNIKYYRERAGLTQEELAETVGVSDKFISAIETSAKFPSLDTFIDIANALHVTAGALTGDDTSLYDAFIGCENFKALPAVRRNKLFAVLDALTKED